MEAQEYFESAAAKIESSVSAKLSEVCQMIAEYARSIAPVKTGEYANSIHIEQDGPLQFRLVASTPYAAVIEYGSVPHIITPGFSAAIIKGQAGALFARQKMKASVLRFEVGGEIVFAAYVLHPGTAPQMIIHRAKKDNLAAIVEAVRAGVQEALH